MNKLTLNLSAAALVLISGTTLMAQASTTTQPTTTQPTNPPRTTDPARTPGGTSDGAVMTRDASSMESRSATLVPTDWVVGEKVLDNGREKIGRIEDLILDAADGRVVYALVDRDATRDMPGSTVAVPWMAFAWDSTKRELILPMERELLTGAEKFDSARWELLQDETWIDRTYNYFKVDEAAYSDLWGSDAIDDMDRTDPDPDHRDRNRGTPAPRDPAHDPAMKDSDAIDSDTKDAARDPADPDGTLGTPARDGTQYVLASKVNGQTLRGSEDKQIGEVKELVFDANSGRMAFIVATFGGFLGIGDSQVAVPWDYFKVNDEGRLYTNEIKADVVRNAPRIEGSDWAVLSDREFGPRVYKHYGRDPSWFDSGSGGRVLGTDRGLDLDDDDAEDMKDDMKDDMEDAKDRMVDADDDHYTSLYTSGTQSDVTGTVTRISREEPVSGAGQIKTIVVKTDSGDRLVHLAPDAYLSEKNFNLKEGDRVTIKGRSATLNGKQIVIASSYRGPDGKDLQFRDDHGSPMWSSDR